MSITGYPQLLRKGLKACEWTIVERQTQQFSRNGSGPVIELGRAYWEISCEYDTFLESDWRAMTAFVNGLRGARNPFRAFRPDRRRAINAGETGTPSLAVSISSGDLIAASTVALAPGDMIAYDTATGARFVGEVISVSDTGSGSQQIETVPTFEVPAASSNASMIEAEGLFTLMPSTLTISEPYDPKKRIRFRARQWERAFA